MTKVSPLTIQNNRQYQNRLTQKVKIQNSQFEEKIISIAEHIPLGSFILDNIGNLISLSIALWQTANNQTVSQLEKQGIAAQESGKLLSSFSCLPVFLITSRLTKNLFKHWSPIGSKAISDVIGVLGSFIYNDIVGSLLKNWLSVNFLKNGFAQTLLSFFGNKDVNILNSSQDKKLIQ